MRGPKVRGRQALPQHNIIPLLKGPVQRGTPVLELDPTSGKPRLLRCGSPDAHGTFRRLQAGQGMAPGYALILAAGNKLVLCIVPCRLKKTITLFAGNRLGDQQGLRDQRGNEARSRRGRLPRQWRTLLWRRRACSHRRKWIATRRTAARVESKGRSSSRLARSSSDAAVRPWAAARKQTEALVEPLCDLPGCEHIRASGSELDCERDAVQPATDLNNISRIVVGQRKCRDRPHAHGRQTARQRRSDDASCDVRHESGGTDSDGSR